MLFIWGCCGAFGLAAGAAPGVEDEGGCTGVAMLTEGFVGGVLVDLNCCC